MKLSEEYKKLLAQRTAIEGDIDYDTNPVIKQMVSLLTADMKETIHFIETECTSEQFIWLSEIFDEIAIKSQSPEFIVALRNAAAKFPKEAEKYNLKYFIDSAAEYIKNGNSSLTDI